MFVHGSFLKMFIFIDYLFGSAVFLLQVQYKYYNNKCFLNKKQITNNFKFLILVIFFSSGAPSSTS